MSAARPPRMNASTASTYDLIREMELQRGLLQKALRPPSRSVRPPSLGGSRRRTGAYSARSPSRLAVEDAWAQLRTLLRERFGMALAPGQRFVLENRLADIPERLGFESLVGYLAAAAEPGASMSLLDPLLDALTVPETSFFRDASTWTALERTVLPAILAAHTSSAVRIWCAGCATGQEPYSLAMLLAERFPELLPRVEILATDVAPGALAQAREGRYSAAEVGRGLSLERQARHLVQRESGFEIAPALRARIRFQRHNLLDAPPMERCELLLCRNVLYFLDGSVRERLVSRLCSVVSPHGALGVETTEVLPMAALGDGWYRA